MQKQEDLLLLQVLRTASEGDVSFFKTWSQNKSLLINPDEHGWTALHYLCFQGKWSLVKTLIDKFKSGATCLPGEKATEWKNLSLLYCAAAGAWTKYEDSARISFEPSTITLEATDDANARQDLLECLLLSCTDVNVKAGEKGYTPLHLAAITNCSSAAITILLPNQASTGKKSSVNVQSGETPPEREDIDVAIKDKAGNTALYYASKEWHAEIVKAFLQRHDPTNVAINVMTKNEVLHYASKKGHTEIVKAFLQREDIDFAFEDVTNNTALHYASQEGHSEIVKMLLSKNRDTVEGNSSSMTPLHLAILYGHAEIADLLLSKTAVDVNAADSYKMTHLQRAAHSGNYEITKLLLDEEDINVNFVHKKSGENTALHFAAQKGRVAVVELLLQHPEVDFTLRNQAGRTAVQLALDNKRHRVVKKFLSYYGCHLHTEKGEDNQNERYCPFCNKAKIAAEQFKGNYTIAVKANCCHKCRVCCPCKTKCSQEKSQEDPVSVSVVEYLVTESMEEAAMMLLNKFIKPAKTENNEKKLLLDYKCLALMPYEGDTKQNSQNNKCICCAKREQSENKWFASNRTLDAISKNQCTRLLTHPVVLSLILRKWKYLRIFVLLYCLVEIALALSLTFNLNYSETYLGLCDRNNSLDCPRSPYCELIRPNGSWSEGVCSNTTLTRQNGSWFESGCSNNTLTGLNGSWSKSGCSNTTRTKFAQPAEFCREDILTGTFITILVSSSILIVKELIEIIMRFIKCEFHLYIFDVENLIQWFAYLSAIIVASNLPHDCSFVNSKEYYWELAAFSVFATWISLLLFLRKFFPGGIFVAMFLEVLSTYFEYLAFFVLFIIAFSTPFFMLFTNEKTFNSTVSSLLKTSIMATGEINIESVAFDDNAPTHYPNSGFIFLSMFIFVMVLIMQNLLTGIAFEDVQRIRQEASFTKLSKIIGMCTEWEQFFLWMCPCCSSCCVDTDLEVEVEKKQHHHLLFDVFLSILDFFKSFGVWCHRCTKKATAKDTLASELEINELHQTLCDEMRLLPDKLSEEEIHGGQRFLLPSENDDKHGYLVLKMKSMKDNFDEKIAELKAKERAPTSETKELKEEIAKIKENVDQRMDSLEGQMSHIARCVERLLIVMGEAVPTATTRSQRVVEQVVDPSLDERKTKPTSLRPLVLVKEAKTPLSEKTKTKAPSVRSFEDEDEDKGGHFSKRRQMRQLLPRQDENEDEESQSVEGAAARQFVVRIDI